MKILFISPWFPYPPTNGSKIRISSLLEILARHHEIDVVSFVRKGEYYDPSCTPKTIKSIETTKLMERAPGRIRSMLSFLSPTPRSFINNHSSEMASLLKKRLEQFHPDLVIASEFATADYLKYVPKEIPTVIEDLELGLLQQNWVLHENSVYQIRRWINWAKITLYFRRLLKDVDAVTVVSENERLLLEQVVPQAKKVVIIPNGVDTKKLRFEAIQPEPETIIFNGSLTFSTNYDAISFFLEKIFPIIQSNVPDATLSITGSTEGVDLASLQVTENVCFTGFIPDIHQRLAKSRVCVVPLRLGGGTRLKILEAMAVGTPVVATSKAVEGINTTSGQNILIGDSPEDFATHVTALLKDDALRERLTRNARELVENHYDWSGIGTRLLRLIEDIEQRKGESLQQ